MNLFLDIETIPREEPTIDEIKACSACKKADTIEEDFKNNYDKLLEKALKKKGVGLMDNKIVCLAYAFDDAPVVSLSGTEEEIMVGFEEAIKENSLTYTEIEMVGFNIRKFDAPVIFLRACLYDNKEVKFVLSSGRNKIKDVMEMAVYWNRNTYVSLDRACKFFGLEGKAGVDGSMVYPMYKEGKYKEIAEYCRQDVEKTRSLYKKLDVWVY